MPTYRGKVERKRVSAGSKSEREAVVLVTDETTWVLRRVGGNPLHDPELDALVGKCVLCEGEPASTTLIVSEWTVEPSGRRTRRPRSS